MRRSHHILTSIAVVVSVIFAAIIAVIIYDIETRDIKQNFMLKVDNTANELQIELRLNFHALHAVKGLFIASGQISAKEFRNISSYLLDHHSALRALEWVTRTKAEQRNLVEQQRQHEYPGFQFTERAPDGQLVRAGHRNEYFPVYYAEPLINNKVAVGFDLGSEPVRLNTLSRARDFNLLLSSSRLTLVQKKAQENTQQRGFISLLPVYQGDPTSISARREALRGFILGVYCFDQLAENVFNYIPAGNISYQLFDKTERPAEQIYQYGPTTDLSTTIHYENKLPPTAGRQWTLQATPTTSYVSSQRTLMPHLAFIFCLCFNLAIVIYTRILQQQRLKLDLANKQLHNLSNTDGLTGTANRRSFNDQLQREWQRAIIERRAIGLLLIDIDYFKKYNDNYGHLAGDDCLKSVSDALVLSCSVSNYTVSRYGGEEFAIIISEPDDANYIAERCRTQIERLQIRHAYSDIAGIVTISIGASTIQPSSDMSPDTLITKADRALYSSKAKGRNNTFYQI